MARRPVIPASLASLNAEAVARGYVTVAGRGAARSGPAKFSVRRVSPSEVVVSAPGLRLVSEANARERVGERIKRVSEERDAMAATLRGVPPVKPPVVAWVLRGAARRMDRDNLAVAAKHLADAVARWAGVDDGDADGFYCHADQEPADGYEVRVYIHTHDDNDGAGHRPWYVTRNAADRWSELFANGADRASSTDQLLRIAREASEVPGVRSVMGQRVYSHGSHPAALFLVGHDLRPPSTRILVSVTDPGRVRAAAPRPRTEATVPLKRQ